jgi:hypothetical protein
MSTGQARWSSGCSTQGTQGCRSEGTAGSAGAALPGNRVHRNSNEQRVTRTAEVSRAGDKPKSSQ